MKFYIVDVFPQKKFSGNQVAVLIIDYEINAEKMQKIALEMNFSETIFVSSKKKGDGSYDVRVFTPEKEVEYSGHAIIGCAYVLLSFYSNNQKLESIALNLSNSSVEVQIEYCKENKKEIYAFWIHDKIPKYGHEFERILLSRVLNIEPEFIDNNFPIVEVDTGLPMIIVPVKNLRTMKEIRINLKRYSWLVDIATAKCILVFSTETYDPENDINARVFADYFGIPEDPATGSGNGALAAYLHKYGIVSSSKEMIEIKIEQGFEINRPSIIYARIDKKEDPPKILVGGNVILVAEGSFYL